MRTAAARNGQGFTAFVAETTNEAAVAILKGRDADEPAVPAALPVRLEDVATRLDEMLAKIGAAPEPARMEEMAARLDRIERASRRGRWRR